MADHSAIEWTDATWNPVTGCTKITAGCDNCYAARFSERFRGVPGHPFENGFDLTLRPERLDQPLRWRRGRMIFVNSMSDLFHKAIPTSFIDRIFDTMEAANWHTYQVLTKRGARMARFFRTRGVPDNAWLGVSVENKRHGVPRIDHLRQVQARIRFLSVEPLLENVGELNLKGIHWVIVGGESGPKARAMKPEWAESVRVQCEEQDVAFFFKQWGGWGADGQRRAKQANGRTLNGRTWDAMPAMVAA